MLSFKYGWIFHQYMAIFVSLENKTSIENKNHLCSGYRKK